MGKFRQLQDQMTFSIDIPTDEKGMTGRECPQKDCLGYFKVKFGTGLKGEGLPCVCPYCGHKGPHDTFWTQEQLDYAQSIAMREVTDLVVKELKKSEFNIRPKGAFGIGISMKVKPGTPHPIRYYREKRLETDVICSACTLEYAIYGVFGFCPDCGIHNSLQILEKNLELVRKEIDLAQSADDAELRAHLIGDALENAVSAFDGFGREAAASHAQHSTNPKQIEKLSFQNLSAANTTVQKLFGITLQDGVTSDEWTLLVRCFQKRHLLAHKMGVVDDKYIAATHDWSAVAGRKVTIGVDEVGTLLEAVRRLGHYLVTSLGKKSF